MQSKIQNELKNETKIPQNSYTELLERVKEPLNVKQRKYYPYKNKNVVFVRFYKKE